MGSSTCPPFSVQTLVRHSFPFIDAITGVLPHASLALGACFFGTGANVHPPLPGMVKSLDLKMWDFIKNHSRKAAKAQRKNIGKPCQGYAGAFAEP
jgi:hypothetical protein